LANGPRPGDRAPDVAGLRRQCLGYPLRLYELLQGTAHVLLVYTVQAADLSSLPHLGIRGYVITPQDTGKLKTELPIIEDSPGAFKESYGAGMAAIYLVRPDGYIGYRSDQLTWAPLCNHMRKSLRL
jgi:hypothetical protein